MKKVPEHEHKEIFLSFIVFFLAGFVLIDDLHLKDRKISSLENNLTEMQTWIKENSKTQLIFRETPPESKLSESTDYYLARINKTWYIAREIHILKDTNISTERFFK